MKRQLLGLKGAVLAVGLLALGCKTDPTAGLVGGVSTVTTSLSYVTVNVGDSILMSAAVRDAAGNPVPVAATLSSSSEAVATVATVTAAPLDYTNFFLKGVGYGTTQILVTAGAAVDTINVHTYPASVKIGGAVDSLGSGSTRQMSVIALDAAGNTITVSDPFVWKSSNTAVVSVDSVTGLLTAATPGKATITLTGPGSPSAVTTTVDIPVKPGTFTGTLSAATGVAGTVITVTKAAGDPAFDADVGATVGSWVAWVTNNTGNTIQVVIPPIGAAGSAPITITNIGAGQLAKIAAFSLSSAAFADPFAPGNDAPGTTAQHMKTNGDYFVVLYGNCSDTGAGQGTSPVGTDRCDKYLDLTNTSGASITVNLVATWQDKTGAIVTSSTATATDVDMITCNAACTGSFNFGGATGANPEKITALTITAGTVRRVWFNLYNAGVQGPAILVKLTLSGLAAPLP